MKRILFFDDEPFITGYLIHSLRDIYGWKGDKEITFVSTSDELLYEIVNNAKEYDLFVLDVMAPLPSIGFRDFLTKEERIKMDNGMSTGLVVAEMIRKITEKAPVLFLSARNIPPIPECERGFTAYIRKPASPEEVSRKMNELMDKM